RHRHADHDRDEIAADDLLGGHDRPLEDDVPALEEVAPHLRRWRQEVFLDAEEADGELPQQEERPEDQDHPRALAEPGGNAGNDAGGRVAAQAGRGGTHAASVRLAAGASIVPKSAGMLISMISMSSERPTTLWGTPAGC